MSGEDYRIESLERRVHHLERRLARLESAAVQGTEREAGEGGEAGEVPHLMPPPRIAPATIAAATPLPPPRPLVPPMRRPVSGEHPPVPAPQAAPATAASRPIAAPALTWGAQPDQAQHAPAEPRPGLSLKDLEERFAGRALAWVGGIALVAAAVFFLSLAFSRGWITEPMRVLVGLAAGAASLGAGAFLLARRSPLVGNVLAGVGLGIISVSLLAATRLYGLIPAEVGLAAALASAIAAAIIAIRFDARSVAAYGLIAALVAPPLVGASPTLLTLLFVAVTLVGTTAISLFRSWRWLPQLAFVLAAPQLADWLAGDPDVPQAVVALAGFWLVNVVAAAGEEIRIRRDDLRPSSATLVLANAAFLLWGLLVVLDGRYEGLRGTAVALASLAHLLIGGWFLGRQGYQHLFGNLVAGTGVALLAVAAFLQLGAPAVPVAWAAEATALAWLAVRRRHGWSALAALVLGGLAILHLVVVEYPLEQAGIPAQVTFDPPLLHPAFATLVALVLALVVTGFVVRARWVRSALGAVGLLLVAYAVTFEATGPVLAAALVVTALSGLVLDRWLARLGTAPGFEDVASITSLAWFASSASPVAGIMAVTLLFSTELPPQDLGTIAATPFLNPAFASLAVVLAGLFVAGVLLPARWVRSMLGGAAILLLAWGLAFQVTGVGLIAWLAVLLPAGVILDRGLARLPDGPAYPVLPDVPALELTASAAGVLAWAAGVVYAAATLLQPWDWGQVTPPAIPFSDERALAAALLAASSLAAARWLQPMALRRSAVLAAIAVGAWVVPFEVYADGVVVLWVLLAAAAFPALRWDAGGGPAYAGLAGLLWAGGLVVALAIVARPDRLWVVDTSLVERAPLLAGWPLSFAALAAGAWAGPRLPSFARWRRALELVAGVLVVYAVSVALVDVFQRQVGGPVPAEELAKQAQVALSVCWTAIGLVALAAGLARRRAQLRHAGFALLGLATAKVFIIDLAAMDVAYRAIVLAGLGLLLLVGAFVVTHSRGPRAGPSGLAGGAGTAS